MSRVDRLLNLMDISEMARVGFLGKDNDLEMRVYEEPQGNPSFHLLSKSKEYQVVLQVKDLKVLEFKRNKYKLKGIPKSHLRAVIEFFKAKRKNNPKLTNWEFFVDTWLTHNPTYSLDRDMPDYKI